VKHDGISASDLTSTDGEKKKKVFDEIKRVITAKLAARPDDCDDDLPHEDTEMYRQNEESFNWRPHSNYFPDGQDPRREIFDPNLDYRRSSDMKQAFTCTTTQMKYRRRQLASQMHNVVLPVLSTDACVDPISHTQRKTAMLTRCVWKRRWTDVIESKSEPSHRGIMHT